MSASAVQMIPSAVDRFGSRVRAVPDDSWDLETQAARETVRQVVDHVTTEHLWAPHVLAGETLEEVGDRYDGDVLGDDPVAAWDDAAARSRGSWQEVEPGTTVHTSLGKNTVADYAAQMLLDVTVREWDVARATGQDEGLDAEAVESSLAYARRHVEEFRALGISEPIPTSSDDPTVQFLALLGRLA